MAVMANLKAQSDYYNLRKPTAGDFLKDVKAKGYHAAWAEWSMWEAMRMSPADIMDVGGATYAFLINGCAPALNWTALFKPGETVRLRVINASAMTTFDVRIPGLKLTVVAADGSDIEPLEVEEFRIGVAETYDLHVRPEADQAYCIFAQAQDRTGYARGTLASRQGQTAPVPPMDPRPVRTMGDMGMDMQAMGGTRRGAALRLEELANNPSVDNVAAVVKSRLDEAGDGLDGNGRALLYYGDMRALVSSPALPPSRDVTLHLTGNMQRFTWGFDGKRFSQAEPIGLALGERVRFILINDTMMEHPIHLHGFLFALENGQDDAPPIKHTVNVKPAEKVSFVFTADTPGAWAFHCHLMYHMEAGMFRTVLVA
jgi:FtsP/CotA-like multicopper oxidase with cupredoxin domain